MAHVNDNHETITIYNINMKKAIVLPLKNLETPIPYSHSTIVTPDSQVFINGGISLSNGHITSNNYEFSSKTLSLDKKSPMLVKRVGHSLVYLENNGGSIYAIGGITNNNVRTKLCEKYSIATNKWTKIASLNHGRSRSAATSFNESSIYVFFGTSSRGFTLNSVEKYDAIHDRWIEISPLNILPTLAVTCAGCFQFNDSKIVIFGGINDSSFNQDNFSLSRRILMYDINNDSINLAEKSLPIDFISSNLNQAILNEGSIYCFGNFFQSIEPKVKKCTDYEYILRLDHNTVEVTEIIKTNVAVNPQR